MELPGHRFDSLIREVPGQRRVMRTFVRGINCVTRVLLHRKLEGNLGPLIERIVLDGKGSVTGIPESIALTLEGYRAASVLPKTPDSPWTYAVAAGISPEGFVYISTRWMEGTPLHQVPRPLSDRLRVPMVKDIARILWELHQRNLVYADFKGENLVATPQGRIVLIDLDTVREVPEPHLPVATKDVTRSWAAPEQLKGQSWLSSDLWAFGRLLTELYPDGVPVAWQELVEACRQQDPLQRPHTQSVYQRIYGQPGVLVDWNNQPTPPGTLPNTLTERLEEEAPEPVLPPTRTVIPATVSLDSLQVEPVVQPGPSRAGPIKIEPIHPLQTDPGQPKPNQAGPVKTRSSFASCLLYLFGGGGLLGLLCMAPLGFLYGQQTEAVNQKADALLDTLKTYKIDPVKNADKTQRGKIRTDAIELASEWISTPHSESVYALAMVWSEGWQDSGKKWDAAAFDTISQVFYSSGGNEPELLLARATLNGAGCKLKKDGEDLCDQSLKDLKRFYRQLSSEEADRWLLVEGAWVEVTVLSVQYTAAQKTSPAKAQSILKDGMERCKETEPYLPWAPVNGPEMLEDCLVLTGMMGDLDSYFHQADLLLASPTATSKQLIFNAAGPSCSKTWPSGKSPSKQADPICLAIGYTATHDYTTAARLLLAQPGATQAADPRWGQLQTVLISKVPQEFATPPPPVFPMHY